MENMNRRYFIGLAGKSLLLASGLAGNALANESRLDPYEGSEIFKYSDREGKHSSRILNKNRDIRFGVACDIHSERQKAEKIADLYSREGVEAILIPGDFSNYSFMNLNFGEGDQIRDSLVPFLETGIDCYVVPGNHESRRGYSDAVLGLSRDYKNLIDMDRFKHVNLNGVNLLGISGGDIPALGGWQIKREIRQLSGDLEGGLIDFRGEPVLVLSHMPPKFDSSISVDCTYKIINESRSLSNRSGINRTFYKGSANERINPKSRGLRNLNRLYSGVVDFSVSGHFHENYGASDIERNIPTKEYSEKLHINPGAVKDDRGAFLTIKDGKAKYELFRFS